MCLEADAAVLAFCERPVYLALAGTKRVVDFWVHDRASERLLILDDDLEASALASSDAALPVQFIRAGELAAARVWIDNWQQMLPYITALER